MFRVDRPVLLALALITVIVPVTAFVATRAFLPDTVKQLDHGAVPVVASPQVGVADFGGQATLSLTREAPVELRAVAAVGGVVTAVVVDAGTSIGQGSKVFDVNGFPVAAIVADAPQYRQVSLGDRGADVADLQRFLSEMLGRNLSDHGSFDEDTLDAVLAYQRSVGVLDPNGTTSPEQFLWLPSGELEVGRVLVVVGDSYPPPSGVVLEGQPGALHASVSGAEGSQEGDYAFVVSGVELGLRLDGSGWSLSDPDRAGELLDQSGTHSSVVEGWLRLLDGPSVVELPGTAVSLSVGGSDQRCVWVRDQNWRAVPVEVVYSTSLGSVQIEFGALGESAKVLVNPHEVLDDPSCP